MPMVFSKQEVQRFLAEQGIDLAEDNQLHEFIHDLKKLIKHEEMQRRRRRLGHLPDETLLNSTDGTSQSTSTGQSTSEQPRTHRNPERPSTRRPVEHLQVEEGDEEDEDEVDNVSSSGSTVSYDSDSDSFETQAYIEHQIVARPVAKRSEPAKISKPPVTKAPPRKDPPVLKRITAPVVVHVPDEQIKPQKPPPNKVNRMVERAAKEPTTTEPRNYPSKNPPGGDVGNSRRPAPPPQPKPSRRPFSGVVNRPKSANSNPANRPRPRTAPAKREPDELFYALDALLSEAGSSEELLGGGDYQSETAPKPKVRAGPPPRVARDPVALYHWYKKYNWDVYSIPGEDRHMQLRWNVRAKTEGHRPCVQGHPISYGKHKL